MQVTPASSSGGEIPLCVDLDGTLLRTDSLVEGILTLAKSGDLSLFLAPLWLWTGRAFLKDQIAQRAKIEPALLPYNQQLLSFLASERAMGRRLVLVTGANYRTADSIAEHLGVFDQIIAGDGQSRMTGTEKCERLRQEFSSGGYDYVGNSQADIPVWKDARSALLVNCPEKIARRARAQNNVTREFYDAPSAGRTWLRALRVHQWSKNLIVFLPVIASHQLFVPSVLGSAAWMFRCFCFMASGTYMFNDLMDLAVDRRHAVKRRRPFASGDLDARCGIVLAPSLMIAALALACLLPAGAFSLLAIYFATTTAYSYRFKQVMLVDVFILASLYTLRLIAGHAATDIRYSHWLLGFSIFFFLSLALLKRAAELRALPRTKGGAPGRGYVRRDLPMVENFGILSGGLAVMVLAMYITSPDVLILYKRPLLLHLLCPVVLYWLGRIWMLTHRGDMHHDPVTFALRDRTSFVVALIGIVIIIMATAPWLN